MTTRVYVGKLHPEVRERDIEKLFRTVGDIAYVKAKIGYAFVQFENYKDAEYAVRSLDGTEFFGERIVVELARGTRREPRDHHYGPIRRTEHRLIVENLSSKVSWQDLKDFMRTVGEVTFVDCHKDREGEGVVEFESAEDKREALRRLDDVELNGRRIILREARLGEKYLTDDRRHRGRDDDRYSDRRDREYHREYDRDYDRDRRHRERDVRRDHDRRSRYRDDDYDRPSRAIKQESGDEGPGNWDAKKRRNSDFTERWGSAKHRDSPPYNGRVVKYERSFTPDRRSRSPARSHY